MGSLTHGVLLIAVGHENYYKMGVNLAASIKRNSPGLQIAIITDKDYSHLNNNHVFDTILYVDESKSPSSLKTDMYSYSPYDKTLYLDVDMLILPDRDLEDVFMYLNGVTFTIMNNCDNSDYAVWADALAIRKYTGNMDDPLPAYYSELVYFEKGETALEYFTEVHNQYLFSDLRGKKFAGDMADELAFILASMKMRVFPHRLNWRPVFWFYVDKKDTIYQPHSLPRSYYGYSMGGNVTPLYVKAHYNNLVTYYSQTMKVTKPFKALDKRVYLSNRSKI